jgi:hypothetical protein
MKQRRATEMPKHKDMSIENDTLPIGIRAMGVGNTAVVASDNVNSTSCDMIKDRPSSPAMMSLFLPNPRVVSSSTVGASTYGQHMVSYPF